MTGGERSFIFEPDSQVQERTGDQQCAEKRREGESLSQNDKYTESRALGGDGLGGGLNSGHVHLPESWNHQPHCGQIARSARQRKLSATATMRRATWLAARHAR